MKKRWKESKATSAETQKSINKAQKTPLIDEPSSESEVEEEDCGIQG